jgi:transposase
MAKKFREWKVEQKWLLPPSVEEFVPVGHLSHFVRETVRESLDLSEILEEYREERGNPPYHPVMMTALLLYSYCRGVYSSRRMAQACEERVDFMAVTGLQRPDFRTISDFRKRHLKALARIFGQVLVLCQGAGLVQLGHVALDGTKLKANASRHKAMSYRRMQQLEPVLAAEVAEWFRRAETADVQEDEESGEERRGDELPEWVADKQKRLKKLREAKAALEAEAREKAEREEAEKQQQGQRYRGGRKRKYAKGEPRAEAQRNFTDAESRIMKTAVGFDQCYNAQAAVDAQGQIIVAQGLTNSATDRHQLVPLIDQIEANTGQRPEEVSADTDYCWEKPLQELERRQIRGYVATGKNKHRQTGPEPRMKIYPGTAVERMHRRLKRGGRRSRYRLRKQTVEPVFGQIKQARGFRQLLLRGLESVQGEWSLLCTAHNLLKLAAATS